MPIISDRYCFTMLRPDDMKRLELDKIPNLAFIIYGYEVGPVSGLPHYQGYFELNRPENLFKIKSILKSCFITVARESREQNIIYCSKCKYYKMLDFRKR